MKAITPDEAKLKFKTSIPDEVLGVVNTLLIGKANRFPITLLSRDIMKGILARFEMTADQVFENGWMDFEDIYRDAGWDVKYEVPDRDESFDARYVFKPKQ